MISYPMLRITQVALFILIVSGTLVSTPVSANDTFRNLTINNGLAHTDANCVVQDSTGLIWIGTNSGLQNFNGYLLQTINYYPANQKVYESHNRINAMGCSKNFLWLGTSSGLTCLDLNTHLYIPYEVNENDRAILNENILQMAIDNVNNRLWIRTLRRFCVAQIDESTRTLFLLDWESDDGREIAWRHSKPQIHCGDAWVSGGNFFARLEVSGHKVRIGKKYNADEVFGEKTSINNLFVSDGFLYLRSPQGCYRIPFVNNELNVQAFSYQEFNKTNPHIPVSTDGMFIVDSNGALWCRYFGGVFEVTNPFTAQAAIHLYLGNTKNVNFSRLRVSSLFIDSYHNLWLSTMNKGLYYRSLSSSPFRSLPSQQFTNLGFSRSEISSIAVQENIALWVIAVEGSLLRYDMKKEKLELISLTAQGTADGLQTLALSADQQTLYIGMARGLIVYEIKTGKSYWLMGRGGKSSLNQSVSVAKIVEDCYGRLWIATWGQGICCIQNPLSNPEVVYSLNAQSQPSINSNFITDMYVERNSIMLCTTVGISKVCLNEQGKIRRVSSYRADKNAPRTLSSDYIACIDRQNDSIYWVGTIGGGLNQVTIHSERDNDYSAIAYTEENGLPNNDCEIVYLDDEQNVWVGGKNIARLIPKNNQVAVYEQADGLLSNSFKIGVGARTANGTIYMGGIDGVNYFHPRDFINGVFPASLSFCQLYINNQLVIPQTSYDGNVTLSAILDKTEQVKLTHNQNNFAISFSAFSYNLSSRIMYRYRMVGYNNEWQEVAYTTDRVYYSNLPYGDYRFELEASIDRGLTWMKPGKMLKLSVLPPWWLTTWAKLSYFVLFSLIITVVIYQYHKEQKLRRENHIQEIQRINDEEKYQSKMRFFMNISHELKTPLTLIMLAAERLADFNLSRECMAILSNSRRMLALITELLDIRKTDLGLNQLSLSSQNMSELVEQLYAEMNPWAEKKDITFSYQPDERDIYMDIDNEKMSKLVINLISNAIKYTPKGGNVKLSLRKGVPADIIPLYATVYHEGTMPAEGLVCILTIQDSGVGISSESIKYIYERFFQVKDTNLTHLGSGIGLAIVKNIVMLHQGCIIVSSQRGTGTEFVVILPVRSASETEEPAAHVSPFSIREFIENQYIEYTPSDEEENSFSAEKTNADLPTLLIVEDNKELQKSLKEQLLSRYNVRLADNGKEGLKLCETLYPDVIISDVMMPEMDGIEMCKRIRDNLSIAYIPIIMLTARGNVDSQIEGYESGADLYIPKPFSIKLLEVNIKRLLTQKERWLRQEQLPLPEKQEVPENGKQIFERKLTSLIEENMGNPDFTVEFLCGELCIGRTKLYNKVKEISEQPLADYIRNVRLEKAIHLLKNSEMNISEVMYEVGFVNSSHFSKTFKQKFGMSPSDYKRQYVNS